MGILVKRYGGSRLYDTVAGRYVSAAQLREWARSDVTFRVIDAASGADVTRLVVG